MSAIDRGIFVQKPPIVLTVADRDRLYALLAISSERKASYEGFLREELARAEIAYGSVPATLLVTMGSEVKFIDHVELRIQQVRLAYPDEAEGDGMVSVLTPLGSALIGLGPGQSITWNECGVDRQLTVLEIGASLQDPPRTAEFRSLHTKGSVLSPT